MRQPYVSPAVKVVGSVRELTLADTVGGQLDADFPDGTPFGDLTFS